MFNFHVGIPGIVPDLLHSTVHAGLLRRDGAPAVLSQKLWKEQFRGQVNAKGTKAALDLAAWPAVEATIADLSEHGAVAISQHAVLGSPEDCFLERKVLPYTDVRIKRVSEIFAAVPLTFHLTISSQFDYLITTMNRLPAGKALPQPGSVPSWSALVRRIRAAAPDRQLIVWDFEQPEKVALWFMICLLDTKDPALIEALDAHLSTTVKRSAHPNSHETPSVPQETIDRMDVQYDLDLEAIKQIEGVSLMLPKRIPEEFHL